MIDYNHSKLILKDLGYRLPKNSFLGEGTNGSAFLLTDNTVLKVTSDYQEYLFAKSIVGINFRRIANVYSAKQISKDAFIINLEYLETNLSLDTIYAFEEYINTLTDKKSKIIDANILFWEKSIKCIQSELDKYHLCIGDLHWSNFGYKNNKLALFDNSF